MKFLKRLFSKTLNQPVNIPNYNEVIYPSDEWTKIAEEINVIVSSALGEGGVDFYNPEEHKPKG